MKTRSANFWMIVVMVCLVAAASAHAAQSPQIPLPGTAIPKYVNQLPLLSSANSTTIPPAPANNTMQTVGGNVPLTIGMHEFKANILPLSTPGITNPDGTAWDGTTWVFGYVDETTVPFNPSVVRDTYIGPVIVNERNDPAATAPAGSTDITYVNNLPAVSFNPATGLLLTPNVLAFGYATDQTMHWADPLNAEANDCADSVARSLFTGGLPYPPFGDPCAQNYEGSIPAVVHLHGGEVPAELDGGPDAWFTSDGLVQGHAYYTFPGAAGNEAIYKYPNTQEASPIWFHDHVLGITRLNVFAGLAGAYLIYDPNLVLPAGLHVAGLMNGPASTNGVEYTVPLVIQDRMFDTNGQLFYTSDTAGGVLWATNPEHPYWTPEFLGDVIVVNGKAWPNLNVEAKRYRFWLINGSNARTYELFLIDPAGVAVPPNMWVIATDGGYLDNAVMAKKLVIMPGERYEVIMDFAGVAPGTMLIMRNTAKSPYPAGVPPQGATTGQVMQFTVFSPPVGFVDNSYNPAVTPAIRSAAAVPPGQTTPVNQQIVRLTTAGAPPQGVALTRLLTLNEVMGAPQAVTDPVTGLVAAYPGGPVEVLVNNTKYGGMYPSLELGAVTPIMKIRPDFAPIPTGNDTTYYSELPKEGSTEVWEIVNLTADAHPIHLHLVQFQIINRQNYNFNKYNKAYNAAFPSAVFDPVTGVNYPAGVFNPGYGPPMPYDPRDLTQPVPVPDTRGNKLGGNPDVAPYLQGKPAPPLPQEAGWKDTVVAYPSQVTRLAVRWAPTDVPLVPVSAADLAFAFEPNHTDQTTGQGTFPHGYVWHCHIIDHEDNEMMRPFSAQNNVNVLPWYDPNTTRTFIKGINY